MKSTPIRNVEIGNTFSVEEFTPHSFAIYGMALLGKELAIVELITVVIVVNKINNFFFCSRISPQLIVCTSVEGCQQ